MKTFSSHHLPLSRKPPFQFTPITRSLFLNPQKRTFTSLPDKHVKGESLKFAFIGLGWTGTGTIHQLAMEGIKPKEIVLVDKGQIAEGRLDDVRAAFAQKDHYPLITPCSPDNLEKIKDADVTVLSFSAAPPFNTSFTEKYLIKDRNWASFANAEIMKVYAKVIRENAPNTIVIVDTNPVDLMAEEFLKHSGMNKDQVIGKGVNMDTQRLRNSLAQAIIKKPENNAKGFTHDKMPGIIAALEAYGENMAIFGIHEAKYMVPSIKKDALILGQPLSALLSDQEITEAFGKAANMGIVSSGKMGSSPYVGSAVMNVEMLKAFLNSGVLFASYALPGTLYGIDKLGLGKGFVPFSGTVGVIENGRVSQVREVPRIAENPDLLKKYQDGIKNQEKQRILLDKVEGFSHKVSSIRKEGYGFSGFKNPDDGTLTLFVNNKGEHANQSILKLLEGNLRQLVNDKEKFKTRSIPGILQIHYIENPFEVIPILEYAGIKLQESSLHLEEYFKNDVEALHQFKQQPFLDGTSPQRSRRL